MQYKILEPKVDMEVRDAKIEKLGVVVTFTFNEIEREEAALNKVLKEIRGKSDYEAAKMKNIEEHHPFVLNLSEEEMFTAHMYQDCKAIVVVSAPKIAEIEKQLQEYADEKAEIIKQIPQLAAPVVDTEVIPVPVGADTIPASGEPVISPIQPNDL